MNMNTTSQTAKVKAARAAVAITRPILSVGIDLLLFTTFVIAAGFGLGAVVLFANEFTQMTLQLGGLTLQDDHGILAGVACYATMIVAYIRFLPPMWRRMRGMADHFKTNFTNNNKEI